MSTKIAIIGGGAGGVAMCLKLYERIREGIVNNNSSESEEPVVEVTVFEKSAIIGPGLPYSSPYKCHVLNFPKKIMKATYDSDALPDVELDDKDGRDNLTNSYQHTVFPPRFLYGEFLTKRAVQVQKEAGKIGIAINFRNNTEIINVAMLDTENIVIETTSEKVMANYVVFCTGHMQASCYRELIGKSGYWHDPFDAKKQLETFDPKKDVVVIGSRKTAIDVSLRLFTEENLEGNVVMVSHNGLLPSVYAKEFTNHQLKYLPEYLKSTQGQPKLDELLPLVWKEISDAQGVPVDFDSIAKSYKDISALEWLDQQIKEADETLKPWQQVLVSIFPLLPTIWRTLNQTDQTTFLKKYFSLFMAYAAGFPQDAAKKIRTLIQNDRLKVCGGLKSITSEEDGQFTVQFDNGTSLTTSQLFNATGAGHDIRTLSLYKNMCKQGSIVAHPMGGIMVNPDNFHVLSEQGKENERIFAIGELTRGVVLLTSDIRRVTLHAGIVADIITQKMAAQNII